MGEEGGYGIEAPELATRCTAQELGLARVYGLCAFIESGVVSSWHCVSSEQGDAMPIVCRLDD